MENIQNSLINLAAPKVNPSKKPSTPAQGGAKDKDSDFHKMMEDQKAQQSAGEKTEPAKEGVEAQSSEGEAPADQELERRMALAAMALVTVPQTIQTAPVEPEAEILPELTAVQLGEEAPVVSQELPQTQTVVQTVEEGAEMPQNTVEETVQTQTTAPQQAKPVEQQPVEQHEQQVERAPIEDKPQQDNAKVNEVQAEPEQPLFREVKAVPIQVGETQAEQKSAEPAHVQVSQRLAEAIRTGESHVEMDLEPRTLGKVHIELSMHKDGTLHVLLRAEKASTQELLHRDAGDLQGILGRETRQEVYVRTERYQDEQPQFYQDQQQDRQDQQQSRQDRRQQHQHQTDSEDFLHQLRLGLTSL